MDTINLTHFNENDNTNNVDIGEKAPSQPIAKACGYINMSPEAIQIIAAGTAQKGDVLGIARIAAIQGAKQAGFLIPLCQVQSLAHIRVDFAVDLDVSRVKATVTVTNNGQNGVEMEALTGVNIALLTIYDMIKTVDKNMVISQIHLEQLSRNKSDNFVYDDAYGNLNL